MIIIMFTLSFMHWVMSIVITFITIDWWQSLFGPVPRTLPVWLPIINALQLFNVSGHYKCSSHIIIRNCL